MSETSITPSVDEQVISPEELAGDAPAPVVTPEVTPASVEQTPAPVSYFLAKRQNVVPSAEPITSEGFDPTTEVLAIPPTFGAAIDDAIARMSQIDLKGDTKWAAALMGGKKIGYDEGEVVPALEDPNALWTRAPAASGGQGLKGHSLRLEAGSGKNISGSRALLTVLSHMGMGTLFRAPMWNTGIWLTIKAPSEARIIEFARQVVENKINLGRSTYGVALSNHMVYTAELFLNLIKECEFNSTAAENVKLASILSVQDFMPAVWALASSIYPSGFNYQRSCVHSPDRCTHVVEERINVSRLLWVNQNALSNDQLRMMSNLTNRSVSLEEIQKYQAQFSVRHGVKKQLTSREGKVLYVTFKVPTLEEFVNVGKRWVEGLSGMVIDALGADASLQARNSYMADLANATSSRQHLHWVESLHVDTDVITDIDTLEQVFESVVSVDDDMREQFKNHVLDFTNKTMTAVVGVPNFTCPNCRKVQHLTEGAGEDENPPAIIPIEAVSTFFDLQFGRISRIRDRA